MRLRKVALTLPLIGTTLFSAANEIKVCPSEKQDLRIQENGSIPKSILKFKNLDFDGRMTLKETMCQQSQIGDFSHIIADELYKKSPSSFALENYKKCWEIVQTGHLLDNLDPQKYSVMEMAHLCGFKRLYSFFEFYQKQGNKPKCFLENKDKQYVSAFMVEEKAFNDVLELYNFETRSKIWFQFQTQIKQYMNKNNISDLTEELYWRNLKKQVRHNLILKKKKLSQTR